MLQFPYTENTSINIDGEVKKIKFFNGMSGLGSRKFWLDDKEPFMLDSCIIHSDIDENKDEEFVFILLEEYHKRLILITKKDLQEIDIDIPYKIVKP